MVQRNYILRLAMGRSAFERPSAQDGNEDEPISSSSSDPNIIQSEAAAQQYDQNGHAVNIESRNAARRLRRAQNDVLSTIGLLVPTSSAAHATPTARRRQHGRHRSSSSVTIVSKEEQKRRAALEEFEEWSSLWLSLGCDALSLTATAFIRNQRKRIQTFRLYRGHSLTRIGLIERRHQSFLSYWLASEAATWAEHGAELLGRLVIMTVPELVGSIWDKVTGVEQSEDEEEQEEPGVYRRLVVSGLEMSMTFAMSVALAPSTAIIALQRLQLIPPRPLVPLPWRYSTTAAYIALLPPFPAKWTAMSTLRFCGRVPTSAIGLSLSMECFFSLLASPLTRYSRAILPRPDNPDPEAVAEIEDNPDLRWFLQGYSHHQTSLKDEIGKDLRWASKKVTYYFFRIRNLFVPTHVRKHREKMLATFTTNDRHPLQDLFDESQQLLRQFQNVNLTDEERAEYQARLHSIETSIASYVRSTRDASGESAQASRQRLQTFLEHAQNELDQTIRALHSGPPSPEGSPDTGHGQEQSDPQRPPNGPLNSHPIPSADSPSIATSSPPPSPPLEPTNVQVRTRAGSTSTLHMDVEINRAAVDGTTYTTSFSASPRTPVVETAVSQVISEPIASGENGVLSDWRSKSTPHHRVSALSLLPSEMLSTVMVQCAIQLLRLPLESMYLRQISRGFLGATAPERVDTVYPLLTWFGDGPWTSTGWKWRGFYALNIFLCISTEALINAGCWSLVSSFSYWMGRRWFSWEDL